MKHPALHSLCATAAISAALAFGSTSALGQDTAAPPIDLPPVAQPAPAAPAPTIVLPQAVTEPAPQTVAEEPTAKPTARAERSVPRPVASRSQESAARPQTSAATDASAPAETTAPAASDAVLIPLPPVVVPEAAEPNAPVAEEPQQDSVRRSIDVPDELIAVSALGVIGLGIAGFVSMRRRRRVQADIYDDVYEPDPSYVAEEPITSIPEALAVWPERASSAPETRAFIPEGPVPTGEARQRLIAEMVAAAPDEENPFTSGKARRKRARIILQTREHGLRDEATEPFDWRTYRSPATVDPATPPMVDA